MRRMADAGSTRRQELKRYLIGFGRSLFVIIGSESTLTMPPWVFRNGTLRTISRIKVRAR